MITRILRCSRLSRALRFDQEGSALVELALSLPLLCLMLLGAAEFGSLAYASIEVTNAAHSAAVYAASSTAASSDSPGIGNAASTDSANLKGSSAVSIVSVTYACTCANTTYTPKSCTDNQTCIDGNSSMVTAVTVKTQSTFSPLIRIPGGGNFTINGQSTEVVSNQ